MSSQVGLALPTIDEVRAEFEIPDGHLAVFASGSALAGWAHAKSDLDLYVITNGPPGVVTHVIQQVPVQPPEVPTAIATVNGVRWDAEYWQEAQIEQILFKVSRRAANDEQRIIFTEAEIDFLYRLWIARALSGGPWLEGVQERLRSDRLPQVLATRFLNISESFIEDAVGLMESGDEWSAVLAVREAFGNAVDALLASHGELSPGRKWRIRKFLRANPSVLGWERYLALETMQDLSLEDPRDWCTKVIEECQEVMIEVDVLQA